MSNIPEPPVAESDFLSQLTNIIGRNIADENFGVSELAREMNMSRSNLLRKVKKESKLSVSQFINQVRLKHAMGLLRKTSSNVSEVSHQVGFNSPSYFIKCFREFYGYPPGEVGKRDTEAAEVESLAPTNGKRKYVLAGSVLAFVALAVTLFLYLKFPTSSTTAGERKSIVVLPFKNDSNDSSNVYLINGLMESTLNNLQKIKGLKVISRTTAEKYRNTSKSIPEMASEMNVQYFVEGSGQKIGDQILLNIQLIHGPSDRHVWAEQYRRQAKDIFALQQEIATDIASEIKVFITPEVEERFGKKPTENLVAYDYFLKGRELFYRSGKGDLMASIEWFDKAIAEDRNFALAYANAVMVFYYLDMFQAEKKYTDMIRTYADKAFSLDSKLEECLIAKGLAHAHKSEHTSAVAYFEKAYESNPNHGLVIHFLTEFYSIHLSDVSKYLEYALRGVEVDGSSSDSATASFKHFHLGNAFVQAGFVEEAIAEINKSLAYNSRAPFAGYLKAYILYAKDRDLKKARDLIINELNKDTTRFDILQEAGKVSYYMKDYESAYRYYKTFVVQREAMQLDLFKHEDLIIAATFAKMGDTKKSDELLGKFLEYARNDRSCYKNISLASYYAYLGEDQKAIDHLRLFSKEENYQYWALLFGVEPYTERLKKNPEFTKVMGEIETKFWNRHEEIRKNLKSKGLL